MIAVEVSNMGMEGMVVCKIAQRKPSIIPDIGLISLYARRNRYGIIELQINNYRGQIV